MLKQKDSNASTLEGSISKNTDAIYDTLNNKKELNIYVFRITAPNNAFTTHSISILASDLGEAESILNKKFSVSNHQKYLSSCYKNSYKKAKLVDFNNKRYSIDEAVLQFNITSGIWAINNLVERKIMWYYGAAHFKNIREE